MRLRALLVVSCAFVTSAMPVAATAAAAAAEHPAVSTAKAKKLAKAGVLTVKDVKGYSGRTPDLLPSDDKDEANLYTSASAWPSRRSLSATGATPS